MSRVGFVAEMLVRRVAIVVLDGGIVERRTKVVRNVRGISVVHGGARAVV